MGRQSKIIESQFPVPDYYILSSSVFSQTAPTHPSIRSWPTNVGIVVKGGLDGDNELQGDAHFKQSTDLWQLCRSCVASLQSVVKAAIISLLSKRTNLRHTNKAGVFDEEGPFES